MTSPVHPRNEIPMSRLGTIGLKDREAARRLLEDQPDILRWLRKKQKLDIAEAKRHRQQRALYLKIRDAVIAASERPSDLRFLRAVFALFDEVEGVDLDAIVLAGEMGEK